MTSDSAAAARRRLHEERYQPLWAAARVRLERTGLLLSNRPMKVNVSGDARAAIAGLVAVSPAGDDPLSVRLDRLDEALRRGAAAIDLVTLLEEVGGPLLDRRASRAGRNAAASAGWQSLREHPAVQTHPGLIEWLDGLRSSGSARRLAGSVEQVAPFVRRALDVLGRLPVDEMSLAVFAVDATGDSHGLDRSTRLGPFVAGALRHIDPRPDGGESGSSPVRGAISWREAWDRVGVVCDEVSVSVLVLNLDTTGKPGGPVSTAVLEHRRAGLPLRLTLNQLRSEALNVTPGIVRSCENPSVLAKAATTLGSQAGPLVCTDGQPNSAVDELLRQARTASATVAHHGDFDWGGIRIANALMSRYQVEPWRFSTSDYLASVADAHLPLEASRHPIAATWDPDLVPTMVERGRCLFEEQVLDDLVEDLQH